MEGGVEGGVFGEMGDREGRVEGGGTSGGAGRGGKRRTQRRAQRAARDHRTVQQSSLTEMRHEDCPGPNVDGVGNGPGMSESGERLQDPVDVEVCNVATRRGEVIYVRL